MIHIHNDFTVWFRNKDGKLKVEIKCAVCSSPLHKAKGAADKGDLVYVLDCPMCQKSLIEYDTPEALSAELKRIV